MYRKFSELTPSEQLHFNDLVRFMKETWNEDIKNKLKVVQKFRLDPNDPVVFDFLTDVYVPEPRPDFLYDEPVPTLPVVPTASQPTVKTKKREMTYANSEDLIIIQNRLLHAISNLTLNERRLILFLSPIVRKQIEKDPNNRMFYVFANEFANEYQLKGKSVYSELEKTADSIVEKAFFFWYKTQNGKSKKGVSWVSECDYIENEAKIKVKLDDTVIEMLTVFDKTTGNFWTQYQRDWIINLGAYGIIMLEMILSSKESNGHYTIEHLREKFDCVDTYKKFSDFKLYVIDKSIKEVHKHTPIRIEYQQHKVGRVVTSLTFSYIDTSIKSVKDKTKNSDDKPKENNPFVNFKMTPKQLAVFGAKIAKKIDKDIEIVIDEISNVHFQGQYVEYLKLLDFVPSDWYTQEEAKSHPTAQQIAKEKAEAEARAKAEKEKAEAEAREVKRMQQEQLKKDLEKLTEHAQEFVEANQKRIGGGIERTYFNQGDYAGVVRMWERYLLDKEARKHFAMIDEILAR
ncbi:RepB family plasmid replication initiator protein [Moraxella equi]|uniref:Replication protein n=1 Tax=Moraxella equi TaxID=60442 RepID=A0A378URE0_9GAMM|nr:RepB family plasmid replication initiator protein [Moraxella equi]OPH37676.1 hypothetical protein B5J93_08115 [Moraxella equi]STZ82938.1 replication protein [Moraxella equi]